MSGYPLDLIIPIDVNFLGGGLGSTNFGIPCFFVETDKAENFGFKSFTDSASIAVQYPDSPMLLEKTVAWFGDSNVFVYVYGYGIEAALADAPAKKTKSKSKTSDAEQKIVFPPVPPETFIDALNAAIIEKWFYWCFWCDDATYGEGTTITEAATICNANTRNYADTERDWAAAIDPNSDTGLSSALKAAGARRSFAAASNVGPLAVKAAAYLSGTNYSSVNGYIDLEYKSITQGPDDVDGNSIPVLKDKNYVINVAIASKGSETGAMLKQTKSMSPHGESVSEVVATDAYVIGLQSAVFNAVSGQDNLGLTREGQSIVISAANAFAESFITNKFLGPRFGIKHPITKKSFDTRGYITLTKPEDIDNLSAADRADNIGVPIVQVIYPAGSMWGVAITVNVQR